MSYANVNLIERLYSAFRANDLAAITALLSPEVEIVQSKELPWGGVYRGHEGFKQFLTAVRAHITSTLSIERFIDSGDHVVVTGRTHGPVVANGNQFDVPFVHVWEIAGGRVIKFHPYIDNPTMQAPLRGCGVC
jgi:ketosteroid isomerase-like protein